MAVDGQVTNTEGGVQVKLDARQPAQTDTGTWNQAVVNGSWDPRIPCARTLTTMLLVALPAGASAGK